MLFALCSMFFLASCGDENIIQCGPYSVEIGVGTDAISAVINGDTVKLPHIISASGARYAGTLNDTNVELWNKGDDWTLYVGTDAPYECN